jgi:hypothetical protein
LAFRLLLLPRGSRPCCLPPFRSPGFTAWRCPVGTKTAFFVEKSDLEWTEDSGKRVVLSYEVQDRSVVFVRLLRQLSAERSHPVPYEAGGATA